MLGQILWNIWSYHASVQQQLGTRNSSGSDRNTSRHASSSFHCGTSYSSGNDTRWDGGNNLIFSFAVLNDGARKVNPMR
jgi:hypothetical protein